MDHATAGGISSNESWDLNHLSIVDTLGWLRRLIKKLTLCELVHFDSLIILRTFIIFLVYE